MRGDSDSLLLQVPAEIQENRSRFEYWYKLSLRHNTLTSDTHVGGPGRYQGLNTGVLLLDLEKMRNSSLYINTTSPDVITRLRNKYQLLGSVGDQDWLTLGKSLLFHIILFYLL